MHVIGFCGYSGSGKTTLVEQLIVRLKLAGQRVSVVKHAHHDFDIDHPGKDSWRHRQAGAFEVVVASDRRLAKIREYEMLSDPTVHQLIAELYVDAERHLKKFGVHPQIIIFFSLVNCTLYIEAIPSFDNARIY